MIYSDDDAIEIETSEIVVKKNNMTGSKAEQLVILQPHLKWLHLYEITHIPALQIVSVQA